MRIEALQKRIKYFLPGGECVVLVPGVPVALPEAAIQALARQAGAHVRVLLDAWTDAAHDPAAPIQPGSYIAFVYQGRLCGGPGDGDRGKVVKVVRHEGEWKCFTGTGLIVSESSVRSVLAMNEHGQPVCAWTTKDHGLDGSRTREQRTTQHAHRRQLVDLLPADQARIMVGFGLSPEIFQALATGSWTPELWNNFWHDKPAVPITTSVTTDPVHVTVVTPTSGSVRRNLPLHREPFMIDTKRGIQQVSAWIVGPFAVHRSWAVCGWTVSHCSSGKALRSRIASKDVAVDAAQRLLGISGCDWTETSILSGSRDAIFAVLQPLPFYFSKKTRAPPRAPPS
jgi:hypothetical protein